MKKLTHKQELELNELKNNLVELNKPLFFDMEESLAKATYCKKVLTELKQENALIKLSQHDRCKKDFDRIQAFLNEYKDLAEIIDGDNFYGFKIGSFDNQRQIWFQYHYSRDWYKDDEERNLEVLGNKYEKFYKEDIEVYSEAIGDLDHYPTIDEVFDNEEYTDLFMELFTEFAATRS